MTTDLRSLQARLADYMRGSLKPGEYTQVAALVKLNRAVRTLPGAEPSEIQAILEQAPPPDVEALIARCVDPASAAAVAAELLAELRRKAGR